MSDKPRCDFYYVLMSEEGLYFADDDYSDDNYPFTGVLRSAVMFYMEETAKTFRDSINLDAKIYKVHSPIIECCEIAQYKHNDEQPDMPEGYLDDIMRKF